MLVLVKSKQQLHQVVGRAERVRVLCLEVAALVKESLPLERDHPSRGLI